MSEMRVTGVMLPAQLHIVHYNTDLFSNICDAAKSEFGLAVLGMFVKVWLLPTTTMQIVPIGLQFTH